MLDPSRFDIIPYTDLSPEASWDHIGKGSFGCVYKCGCLATNRPC
jgi:hypothetical protein